MFIHPINKRRAAAPPIITDGLVRRFDFPEGSGNTTLDDLGNIGNLVGNPAWVAPLNNSGYALEFDGISQYVDIGTLDNFGSSFRDGYTLCSFYRTTSIETSALFGVLNDGDNTGLTVTFNIYFQDSQIIQEDGSVLVWVRDESGGLGYFLSTRGDVSRIDGNTHHFAVASIPASVTGTLYFDGLPVTPVPGNYPTKKNTANFQYGVGISARNDKGVFGNFFQSTVDDFRLYDRVLSAGEIAQIAAGNG